MNLGIFEIIKLRNKETLRILLLLLFILFATIVFAQPGTQETEIFSTSSRKVERGEKLKDKPAYRDSVLQQQNVKYTSLTTQANTTIVPEVLKPANIVPNELLDKLYRFYVKGGLGMYSNILGEVYFNQERNATKDYGFYYKHFSSQGGINDLSYNGFSTNDVGLYGTKLWKSYRTSATINYKRDLLHYYGFNKDSFDISKDKTKQIYNTLWIKLEGSTTYNSDSSKISHSEKLWYRPYFDQRGAQDHNVRLELNGGKRVKKEYYSLNLSIDYNNMFDDSVKTLKLFKTPTIYSYIKQQQNLILTLNPSVTTTTGNLKIKFGCIANADAYDAGANFYFNFDVEAAYSLFNDIFIPYVGINRNTIRNSLYTLSQQNPFILTNNSYTNTNQRLNVFGGFKGTWSSNLSFNSKVSFSQNQNVPLFVNDTMYSFENRFAVVYDNIDILTADAHILYRGGSKWHFLFGGTYFSYKPSNEKFAWNMPQFKVYSTLVYNLKDKFIVRYNLDCNGKRYAYSLLPVKGGTAQPDGKSIFTLKPYIDTDIQFEYRYTKRISAFLNFNNITGKYNRWYQYPTQAFNVMGGLTFMF